MKKTVSLMLTAIFMVCVLAITAGAAEPELITWSFEDGTIAPFTTEDDWGEVALICSRDTDRNDGVTPMDKDGKYFLNTVFFEDGESYDESVTGTLTSPVFQIYDPIVTCLIAGGAPDNYIAVCRASDDEELAVGFNFLMSGHPLIEIEMDLADNYVEGEEVYIKIVDATTSVWAFISVDKIQFKGILTETAAPAVEEPETTAPAVEEPEATAPAVEVTAAPQTFDAGVIAVTAAAVSAAGYALSKKRR